MYKAYIYPFGCSTCFAFSEVLIAFIISLLNVATVVSYIPVLPSSLVISFIVLPTVPSPHPVLYLQKTDRAAFDSTQAVRLTLEEGELERELRVLASSRGCVSSGAVIRRSS